MTENAINICASCNASVDESNAFTWSCGHFYHIRCAKSRINDLLSNYNSIPKCIYPNCNRSLTIQNKQQYDPSKIQAVLPKKYQDGKNMFDYDKNECLIYGFIKEILCLGTSGNVIVPTEIILLIFDYYCLNYFKQIICFLCSGTGIPPGPKEKKCTQCVDGRTFIACRYCNGRGHTYKRYVYGQRITGRYGSEKNTCEICKGKGKLDCGKCQSCKGHLIIRQKYRYCWECYGKKYLISIDFNKLCQKQVLCLECKLYFPMNKITFWNRCHHTYCSPCVDTHIKHQLLKYDNPACPMNDCKFREKLQSKWMKTTCLGRCYPRCHCDKFYFKIYSEMKLSHECENSGMFVWTGCRHVFCKSCIALDIKDDLIKLKIPKCPLTMLHGNENLISMKHLKSLQSYLKGTSDNFNFNYYFRQLKSKYVYCKLCEQSHDRDEVFTWSNCRHKYGIKCVKKYFNGKRLIIKNNLLFCIENKIKRKVVCFNKKCNEVLSAADYKENIFGRIHETRK